MPNRHEVRLQEFALHKDRLSKLTTEELQDGLQMKRFRRGETFVREILRERGAPELKP